MVSVRCWSECGPKRSLRRRPSIESFRTTSASSSSTMLARPSRTPASSLGLPPFTQRNLRQMFIVEAYRAGVDVKTLAKWQGHQDGGKLIMDTYTEAFGADQREFEKKQLMKLAL